MILRRPYTAGVRVLLAALLAILLVAITTADRLACPDGCAEDAPAQASLPQAPSPCALCQGWSPSPVALTPRPAATIAEHVALVTPLTLAPARPAPERPPKSA